MEEAKLGDAVGERRASLATNSGANGASAAR
jgi:hypothetical protein